MPLTQSELALIEEGITLAVSAILAAVRAADNKGPIDWNSVRITQTPEAALAKAKSEVAQSEPRPAGSG